MYGKPYLEFVLCISPIQALFINFPYWYWDLNLRPLQFTSL